MSDPEKEDAESNTTGLHDVPNLKASRAGYKSALTRKRNEIRVLLASAGTVDLQGKLTELKAAWQNFELAHQRYHASLEDDDEIEASFLYFEEEQGKINTIKNKLEERLDLSELEDHSGGMARSSTPERKNTLQQRVKQLEEDLIYSKRMFELEKEYKEKELKLAYERRSLETSLSMGLSVESGAAAVNPSELQARQLQCLEELSKRNLDLVSLTLPQPEIPSFNGNPLD